MRWAAALALLFAFGVSSWHLTRESLWDDEGWSLYAIEPAGAADVLARVREDVHPPLYFLALDLWVRVAGESAYAVRLLSTLFAMLALALTYALGRRWFDAPTGVMALLLLGTAGFFVYYAREARMYSLLLLGAALAAWAYWRWRATPTWRRALGYGAALAALLYTHYAGIFILLTHALHGVIWTALCRGGSRTAPAEDGHLLNERIGDGRGTNGQIGDGRRRRRPYRIAVVGTTRASSAFAGKIPSILRPYLIAVILYLPWMPVLLEQMRAHEARPLALPVVTDWNALVWLAQVTTSDLPLAFVGVALAGLALGWRRHGAALTLLLLWLLLTPAGLLAWNAWLSPVYQTRYAIALLPAAALLAAWGLRAAWGARFAGTMPALSVFAQQGGRGGHDGRRLRRPYGSMTNILLIIVVGWTVYAQLVNYGLFWKPKSRYAEAAAQMTAARQPDEPLIADIYWAGVMAYYDRVYGIRRGVYYDVTRAPQTIRETRAMIDALDSTAPVWVVMPGNVPRTWTTVAALLEGRGVGYRDTVMNMLFYRFDPGGAEALRFRFGDLIRYDGSISGRYALRRGEPLCMELPLTTLAALDGNLSASVQLLNTDRAPLAAWDAGLGAHPAGETLALAPCLETPPDLPAADYWLQLAVYNWRTLARLPLIEADNLYWGDALLPGSAQLE